MKLTISLLLFFALAALYSCENSLSSENEIKISSFDSDESHNAGKDCINCHKNGGEGEGFFQIAGTIYNTSGTSITNGATVKLYTQANGGGTLVKTIQQDKNGNFYSTENIDFSGGLYPVIVSSNSNLKYMPESTTNGACNSCHNGVKEIKLKIN